jgi:hypothetical protein
MEDDLDWSMATGGRRPTAMKKLPVRVVHSLFAMGLASVMYYSYVRTPSRQIIFAHTIF